GEAALGGISVLPAHLYDPEGVMKNFTLSQLTDGEKVADLIAAHPELSDFAADFTSTERSHDPALISGSGPYKLVEWRTGELLRLEKKADWWGNDLKGQDKKPILRAIPSEL